MGKAQIGLQLYTLREALAEDFLGTLRQVAGRDAVSVIGELGPRAPLLHIKDGPAVHGHR